MHDVHDRNSIILFLIGPEGRNMRSTFARAASFASFGGSIMENSTHRVISISLNERDWQAFVRLHPEPQVWLRERIQESIAASVIAAPPSAAAATNTTSATIR
jgi:hypothetical protein